MFVRSSVLLLLLVPALRAGDDLPAPTGGLVAKGAKLELLYTRPESSFAGGLTEGPAAAPDGSIYFTDISQGKDKSLILRYDPATNKTTVFIDDAQKANGMEFDLEGNLVACEGSDYGGRAVVRYDLKTKKRTVLTDHFMGKKYNAPNDLTIDKKGRIYFTDPRYLGDEPRELMYRAVYRIDGKEVVEVTHEVDKPNGIALSPDGKALYLADHDNGTDKIDPNKPAKPGAMKVYSFPLGPDGLVAGKRKTLVDFGTEAGCDGMCVDAAGRIYLTVRSLKRPGVMVIDPEGKEVGFIATGPASQSGAKQPKGLPSNVTFSRGKDKKMLYVTIDKSLYRIRMNVEGYHVADDK